MKIEIDQSGRIEYTRKPTILAFSNSKSHSIIISQKADKKITATDILKLVMK